MKAKMVIPDDLTFSDLHLARDPHGNVSFEWAVIERICQASGLPLAMFRDASEDTVAGFIVRWYQAHRQRGGEADPVAEDLITEVLVEAKAGQTTSHQPGRA
ncbi:hypothetical protein [Pseudomonas sp. MWU12-2323]|uniref:hypothetical protein n=1 Tax=Pseudomonas sp. MWU12-2323 TaxID=2651296 RepID=UPI00128C03CC|nr:hypothetical protein [Pseudomonas sp. MWU12-2323]MPQ69308.1 hypothetical protein [Pseudomonas sp. MWU12-2323]